MYHPSRGGVRGGRDQFNWDDVKVDKHRENYLGHSIKAPVGRWQNGKDLHWYAKGMTSKEVQDAAREEIARIKAEEEQSMREALGLAPKREGKPRGSNIDKHEAAELFKRGAKDESAPDYAAGQRVEGLGFAPAPKPTVCTQDEDRVARRARNADKGRADVPRRESLAVQAKPSEGVATNGVEMGVREKHGQERASAVGIEENKKVAMSSKVGESEVEHGTQVAEEPKLHHNEHGANMDLAKHSKDISGPRDGRNGDGVGEEATVDLDTKEAHRNRDRRERRSHKHRHSKYGKRRNAESGSDDDHIPMKRARGGSDNDRETGKTGRDGRILHPTSSGSDGEKNGRLRDHKGHTKESNGRGKRLFDEDHAENKSRSDYERRRVKRLHRKASDSDSDRERATSFKSRKGREYHDHDRMRSEDKIEKHRRTGRK